MNPVRPVVPADLAALLSPLAHGDGFLSTRLPGVRLLYSQRHIPRSPIAYEPSIVVIAQGKKVGHIGGRKFVYDPGRYLALTIPLPFECETIGSAEAPVLGLSIGLSPALVAELSMQLEPPTAAAESRARAVDSTPIDAPLLDATIRLAQALHTDSDAKILGPQLVREITYRVLCGPLGPGVRALASPASAFGRISRILTKIHTDYAANYDMEALARESGMSASSFHAKFKAVTASSPLQYLKNIRLNKARLLMVNDGLGAAQAALAVGYESASQFSREFRRLFRETPAAEASRMRAELVTL